MGLLGSKHTGPKTHVGSWDTTSETKKGVEEFMITPAVLPNNACMRTAYEQQNNPHLHNPLSTSCVP